MPAVSEHSDEGRISANSLGSPASGCKAAGVPPLDHFHGQGSPTGTGTTAGSWNGAVENPSADLQPGVQASNQLLLDPNDHCIPVSAFAAQAGQARVPSAKQMHLPLEADFRNGAGAPPPVLAL